MGLQFAFYNDAHGQDFSENDCTLDSVRLANITGYLDSNYYIGCIESHLDFWFPSGTQNSHFCSIIIYARIFDKICTEGLDLEYQLSCPTRLFVIDFEPSPEDIAYYKRVEINNIKCYCFRDFIYLKTHYEQQIIAAYYPQKQDIAFEKTINELVNYGGYAHPTMVKNFLLSKYDRFTLEKYEKDLMEMYKK